MLMDIIHEPDDNHLDLEIKCEINVSMIVKCRVFMLLHTQNGDAQSLFLPIWRIYDTLEEEEDC